MEKVTNTHTFDGGFHNTSITVDVLENATFKAQWGDVELVRVSTVDCRRIDQAFCGISNCVCDSGVQYSAYDGHDAELGWIVIN